VGRELSVKAYSNVEDFLSDPTLDAVVIAAPTFAHAELVKAAAAAGKAILCEKPLCLTLEEAEEMAAAVTRTLALGGLRGDCGSRP